MAVLRLKVLQSIGLIVSLYLYLFLILKILANLYFVNADSDRSNIEVAQLNGENRKILLTTRTETPTSLAIDPIGLSFLSRL